MTCGYEKFIKNGKCPATNRLCQHYKRGKCLKASVKFTIDRQQNYPEIRSQKNIPK